MGAGFDEKTVLLVVVLALAFWLGHEVWRGLKWSGHQVKCGVGLVVGHPCESPR